MWCAGRCQPHRWFCGTTWAGLSRIFPRGRHRFLGWTTRARRAGRSFSRRPKTEMPRVTTCVSSFRGESCLASTPRRTVTQQDKEIRPRIPTLHKSRSVSKQSIRGSFSFPKATAPGVWSSGQPASPCSVERADASSIGDWRLTLESMPAAGPPPLPHSPAAPPRTASSTVPPHPGVPAMRGRRARSNRCTARNRCRVPL